MDCEKLFFFSPSWRDVLKMSLHIRRLHHGPEDFQPIVTFRMVGTRAVISVTRVLDNSGSPGCIHYFFAGLCQILTGLFKLCIFIKIIII